MAAWLGNSCRLFALAAALAALVVHAHGPGARQSLPPSGAQLAASYANRTLAFEANVGQVDAEVSFLARASTHTVLISAEETVIQLDASGERQAVMMRLEGSRPGRLAAEEVLPGKVHYFRGNDPGRWRTNVSTYGRVRRAEIYDGIDVVYYGAGRALEYDFVVSPGARVSDIAMRFDGAEAPEISDAGELVLRTATGELRQKPPIVYQARHDVRTPIDGRYVSRRDGSIGFEVGEYDASATLVIDPVLIYSTYLGGNNTDYALGLTVDGDGYVYVTGGANFPFPVRNAPRNVVNGHQDVFITKLSADGSDVIFSTLLGGLDRFGEYGAAIAVDAGGYIYVCGATAAGDFPVLNAFQPTTTSNVNTPENDGFAAKLAPGGATLLYSTYLGGTGYDRCTDLEVDQSGSVFLVGTTHSPNFLTLNARYPLPLGEPGEGDAFVMKLNANGGGVFSTYLGGSGEDEGKAVAVNAAGDVYVAGETASPEFPLVDPIRSERSGSEAFVTKLRGNGTEILFSTFLGGSGRDVANGLVIGPGEHVFVAGGTESFDFPALNAYQSTLRGVSDAFVAKIDAATNDLVFSTRLGGEGSDHANALGVDALGQAILTGSTSSPDLPLVNAFQTSAGSVIGAFVTKFAASGADVIFSTYATGPVLSPPFTTSAALDVDGAGNVYVAGMTYGGLMTTPGAFQTTNPGGESAFVLKIGEAEVPCTYTTDPVSTTVDAMGGDRVAALFVPRGDCSWTAASNAPWLTLTGLVSGSGAAAISYHVQPNPSVIRAGTLTIGGQTVTVVQAGTPQPACSFPLSTWGPVEVSRSGGIETMWVRPTGSDCAWTAASHASWITIVSGANGVGWGTVAYRVAPSPTVPLRTGSITVAARTISVVQQEPLRVAVDRPALFFGAATNGAVFTSQSPAQPVRLAYSRASDAPWIAIPDQPWITVSPESGSGPRTISIGVRRTPELPLSGTVTGVVSIVGGRISNTPIGIQVSLSLTPTEAATAPFGFVDAPAEGATGITGSLPVTGWALDDVGIRAVRILRDPVAGEPAGQLVHLGTAVRVHGARPDVATKYPTLAEHAQAGWGYMLLTNMLPGRGNGTYRLRIVADDRDGHSTELATRTITCTNSTATRPFGAIDTPAQGESISGTSYHNFGWVLAPGTRRADVPGGGSVSVQIDGVTVGTPIGWTSRPDLSALFPAAEYAGINTALAVHTFDPSTLTPGIHTLSWVVFDNLGNGAGIGSRYFTVTGGPTSTVTASSRPLARPLEDAVLAAPIDRRAITGRRGYDLFAPDRTYGPDAYGTTTVHGEELDRFELELRAPSGGTELTGHLHVGRELRPLPIGSRLDASTGVFTWQPGVAFIGPYDLVFVRWTNGRAVSRQDVRIVLHPKGSGRVGPQVVIDLPALAGRNFSSATVAQPFVVAGWAADLDAWSGTGMGTLHVWAYPARGGAPIFLGAAAYGGRRPDVGAVYGDQFTESGYSLTVRSLPPGEYMLAVFGYSLVQNEFVPAKTVSVTVR